MIPDEYRNAPERTSDSLYNAQYIVITAWQLAAELNSSNDRHSNALLGNSIEMHNAEWEAMKAQVKKAE